MAKKRKPTTKKAQTKSSQVEAAAPEGTSLNAPEKTYFSEILIAFFTAFIIIIVRMHSYERPMQQFYWSGGESQLSDFFSYFKMVAILVCGILALLVILYRITTATLYIKKSFAYIPMLIYAIFVILSYVFSDYKEFSLYGYNDRFEGTLVLLCYMVMLFFVINSIHNERSVKWLIYPLGVASALLGLLGLSQGLGRDFFQTDIGKKLITPRYFWEHIDSLNFTFQNKEIYQTVYNINYVSFYLTLLIPLFGMLFIREKKLAKKIVWGLLFALLVYNLIGSKSSGGLAGMFVAVLIAVIVLNRKLLDWKKSVLILIVITIAIGGITFDRWFSELSGAFNSMITTSSAMEGKSEKEGPAPGSVRPHIDYFETLDDAVHLSLNGEELRINITRQDDGTAEGIILKDKEDNPLPLRPIEDKSTFSIEDERFRPYATITYASSEDQYYVLVNTVNMQWAFAITDDGMYYSNQLGNLVKLEKIPSMGWENNQGFGSGRGYIWSRTLPMIKDTILLGHGADTYCIYFPHKDYAGKYNADWEINKIVDKPHNMYMGMAIGTGLISMLSLLVLWAIYIIQSIKLYLRTEFDSYISFVGAGIFFGICGFLVAGLVNDSSVSVMPMFYGLLGTGIAINMMLNSEYKNV
jgi:O-antigen ligase